MAVFRLLKLVAIALAVVLPLRAYVGEPITVASPSMEPSYRVGTMLILDKASLRWHEPRRGDVISFRSPVEPLDVVKRVIAIPGDTIEMRQKAVYVNGNALDEPYVVHDRASEKLDGDDLPLQIVPAGAYFMLGDNRDESNDSSVWKDSAGNRIPFLRRDRVQGFVRRLPWAL